MKSLLFFTFSIGLSSAAILLDTPCPNRVAMTNFNITRYSGTWYGLRRTSNYHQRGFDCTYYVVLPIGNDTIELVTCEKVQDTSSCVEGFCHLKNPRAGKLLCTEYNYRR